MLTPGQWAFAAFHTLQDEREQHAIAHNLLNEEIGLHFLLRADAEKAVRLITGKPPTDPVSEEEEAMVTAAADPYFGTIGGPEFPVPTFGFDPQTMPPDQFGHEFHPEPPPLRMPGFNPFGGTAPVPPH